MINTRLKIIYFSLMLAGLSSLFLQVKQNLIFLLCINNTFNELYIIYVLAFILGGLVQVLEYIVYTEILKQYNNLKLNFKIFLKILFLSLNLLQIYILSNLYYLFNYDINLYNNMLIIILFMLLGRSTFNSLFIMAHIYKN